MKLGVTYDLRPENLEYLSQTSVMECIDSIPISLAYFPALSSIHQHRQHIALIKPQLGRSAVLVRGPNLLNPNKNRPRPYDAAVNVCLRAFLGINLSTQVRKSIRILYLLFIDGDPLLDFCCNTRYFLLLDVYLSSAFCRDCYQLIYF